MYICIGLTYASNPNYEINSEALSRQSPSGGLPTYYNIYSIPHPIYIYIYIYIHTYIQNTYTYYSLIIINKQSRHN